MTKKKKRLKPAAINWLVVYSVLGMRSQYLKAMRVPATKKIVKRPPNSWKIPVLAGLTVGWLIETIAKISRGCLCVNGITTAALRHIIKDSYVASFEKRSESFPGKTTPGCEEMTLKERLLLEIGFFLATGQHPDAKSVTTCSSAEEDCSWSEYFVAYDPDKDMLHIGEASSTRAIFASRKKKTFMRGSLSKYLIK